MTTSPHTGARQLPIVKLDGRWYFVDLRLRQLRDTSDPHSYIDFDDKWELRWYLSKRGIAGPLGPF